MRNANEIKEMMPTVEDYLRWAEQDIIGQAKKGFYYVRLTGVLWSDWKHPLYHKVIKEIQSLGYTIKYDPYDEYAASTKIEWE